MAYDYGEVVEERIIRKSTLEQIRVQKITRADGDFLDIRIWSARGDFEKTQDGHEELVFRPTKRGVRFRAELAEELANAISELVDFSSIGEESLL